MTSLQAEVKDIKPSLAFLHLAAFQWLERLISTELEGSQMHVKQAIKRRLTISRRLAILYYLKRKSKITLEHPCQHNSNTGCWDGTRLLLLKIIFLTKDNAVLRSHKSFWLWSR